MAFFGGLIFFYGLFWLVSLVAYQQYFTSQLCGIWAASIMFILIGLAHFIKPDKIEAMIPDAMQDYKRLLNYTSGFFEIVFGVLLLFPITREPAAYGLILLLIAVFPANINMAKKKPGFYTISRLFFQPVYIFWIVYFALNIVK